MLVARFWIVPHRARSGTKNFVLVRVSPCHRLGETLSDELLPLPPRSGPIAVSERADRRCRSCSRCCRWSRAGCLRRTRDTARAATLSSSLRGSGASATERVGAGTFPVLFFDAAAGRIRRATRSSFFLPKSSRSNVRHSSFRRSLERSCRIS